MATQLEIINSVQRRLREPESASVATNDYSKLLGEFLNDIIQEMLDEHDWSQFESRAVIPIDSTTDTYLIPGSTNQSELRYNEGQPNVTIFESSADTQGSPMIELNKQLWNYFDKLGWGAVNDPVYFAVNKSATTDNLYIQVLPPPNTAREIRLDIWTPPDRLTTDGSTDGTEIYLPVQTLILGVLYLAFNERGEEMGEPGSLAEKRYYASLSSAIYSDMQNRGRTNEYEFHSDYFC